MIEDLSGVTPALVRLSLDALLLRHEGQTRAAYQALPRSS